MARSAAARSHARRAADEVTAVLLDDLVGHTGLVIVLALDVPDRDDLHEVLVPLIILREEDEVIVFLVLRVLQPVVIVARHVYLAADHGLHRRELLRRIAEVLHPVHVPVVRDREAGHAQLAGALEEFRDIGHSIEDGVLGMDVQMDEWHRYKCTQKPPISSRKPGVFSNSLKRLTSAPSSRRSSSSHRT